jgi:hypothetical protein
MSTAGSCSALLSTSNSARPNNHNNAEAVMVDGIYSLTYRGAVDWGIGMLVMQRGIIVGSDAGGVLYDGTLLVSRSRPSPCPSGRQHQTVLSMAATMRWVRLRAKGIAR